MVLKWMLPMPTGSLPTQLTENKCEPASELSEWHTDLQDDLIPELFYSQLTNLSMNWEQKLERQ